MLIEEVVLEAREGLKYYNKTTFALFLDCLWCRYYI